MLREYGLLSQENESGRQFLRPALRRAHGDARRRHEGCLGMVGVHALGVDSEYPQHVRDGMQALLRIPSASDQVVNH